MTITMADMAADAGVAPPKKVKKPKKTEGADHALVAKASEDLRALIKGSVDKGIEDAGELLLARFFGGDHKLYGGKNPESPSLNLLLKRCGKSKLHVSRTFIGNALRLAVFKQCVPEGSAFQKLSPSHRIELLCLGDPHDQQVIDLVEAIAEESLAGDYSVRQLRLEVNATRGVGKRKKPADRAIDSCVNTMTDRESGALAFAPADLEGMTAEQLDHVESQARVLEQRAKELAAMVRSRRAKLAREAAKGEVVKGEAHDVEKEAKKTPTASKPKVEGAPATAAKASGSKATPVKPSRRRDERKASTSATKASGPAEAEKPAAPSAGGADQVSRTSETTVETTVKAAGEPAAPKGEKTAT